MAVIRGRVRSPLLDLVRLPSVRRRGAGSPDVTIGLVTAPADAAALAGVLGADPLAICPLSPVTTRTCPAGGITLNDLATLLSELLDGPARVIVVGTPVLGGDRGHLTDVMDRAARAGVLVVAGEQATPTPLTEHPWTLPVFSCTSSGRVSWFVDIDGDPRGLFAPGEDIPGPAGPATGNTVAATVVAGTAALLWSLFPHASGHSVRAALSIGTTQRRYGPPLLDAERAHEFLRGQSTDRQHRSHGRPHR